MNCSANRLFSTGFIDSVLNQKQFSKLAEDDWSQVRWEAQNKRYVDGALKLSVSQRDSQPQLEGTARGQPAAAENLDNLVQNFLNKDTESTIRLNSSLGQFGDEILGDTFQREQSYRTSVATDQNQEKTSIGVFGRKSDVLPANRVSAISANTGSFQQPTTQQSSMVTSIAAAST